MKGKMHGFDSVSLVAIVLHDVDSGSVDFEEVLAHGQEVVYNVVENVDSLFMVIFVYLCKLLFTNLIITIFLRFQQLYFYI